MANEEYEQMQAAVALKAEKQKETTLKVVETAGNRMFSRECKSYGIDPARGVSPSLLKLLGWHREERDGELVLVAPGKV